MTAATHKAIFDWLFSLTFEGLSLKALKDYIEQQQLIPDAKIITVTGTNGKGSTVEALSHLLQWQGYRVGKFTSPHLFQFNERIQLNNQPIDDNSLAIILERIRTTLPETYHQYFAVAWLAALYYFNTADVDFIIFEVGIGGRFDCTNLLDADLAIITSVGLDHMDRLGQSREAVAWHKIGIARPHKPLIVADPNPPALIQQLAQANQYDLLQAGIDYHVQQDFTHWHWQSKKQSLLGLPRPKLVIDNLGAALMATECLSSRKIINPGQLADLSLIGRQECISTEPEIIIDVSHNPHALARLFSSLSPGKTNIALVAGLADKDLLGMIQLAAPYIDHWVLADIGNSRALSVANFASLIQRLQPKARLSLQGPTSQAFRYGLSLVTHHHRLLVFGCFALVAEVRQCFFNGDSTPA